MKLFSKWGPAQWFGSILLVTGLIGAGFFSVPRAASIPPVPIDQLGLVTDHAERAQVVAASMPKFRLVGDAAAEDNSKKNVRLWDAMLQLRGSHFPNVAQEIGDCVSWGAANAVNYLQAVQLIRGPPAPEEFHAAYPPWIYGSSRVWIGAKHGSHFRGDGSVGAYAAEALSTYGCLRADYDGVPPYSGAVAKQWGDKGPPEWAKEVAKPYLVKTVAPVGSAADARDAICNGFPVTIASGWWGTQDIPIVNGRRVARRTTSWGHQQCLIAYDGSQPGEPLFYCLNSWGPNAHPAPMQGEPPGGYWIRFKDVDHICGEGDSWALSAFDGFPAETINWDDLKRRPSVSMAPKDQVPKMEAPQMSWIDSFSESVYAVPLCIAIAILGFVLFLKARKIAPTVVVTMIGLAFAGGSVGHAQDFAGAMTRQTNDHVQAFQSAATRCDMDWTAAAVRPVIAERKELPKSQALVFLRTVGCSDCTKETGHLKTNVAPLGWEVGESEFADFRLIDITKQPLLAQKYNVSVVPTTIYLDRERRIVERLEGFWSGRSYTNKLNDLR